MTKRAVRVGIDVGGTHTKAVALDNATHEILGKASVKTTHDHPMGVSHGIIEAFNKCLTENGIEPDDIIFIAHSTTQATNALLEGDVASVGVLGMGCGFLEGLMAKKQTKIDDIPLGAGKVIPVRHSYLNTKNLTPQAISEAVQLLADQGAEVVVASMAFGVDHQHEEMLVQKHCIEAGVPVTMASDITKLYGLTIRTRTAAINASIMPKMIHTATSIETTVKDAGIKVPLMIMRGDGGVIDVTEMKKRPVLTMLSGPAASVIGALMYLRASNGIYFEVGGTSTNIGVIKNGRPAINYAKIGDHRTFISSLDVRVLGIAGGSMVRVRNGKMIDVGPRSAHIAGMPYAAFTPEEEMEDPVVEYISPKPGDPDDYVVVRVKSGRRIAITNTCAANVLGLATEEMFSHGIVPSCRKAMEALAKVTGQSVEDTARTILHISTDKIVPVIEELAQFYKLEREQMMLVGVGGGAGALLPFAADRMKLPYHLPENAEIISSIGVALAMVRDVVERVIPNPTPEDIAKIRHEATELAVNSGAVESSVEVHVEIDTLTQKVTAIALGSTEVQTTDLLKEVTQEEARRIAADSLALPVQQVSLEASTEGIFVFSAPHQNKGDAARIRVVDKKGFIKVQCSDGKVVPTLVSGLERDLYSLWEKVSDFSTDIAIAPDIFLCIGSRVVDCTGVNEKEQALNILSSEVLFCPEDEPLVLVGTRNTLWGNKK